MSYQVIVPAARDSAFWLPMTRWLELRVGSLYVDWDANQIKPNEFSDGEVLYEFRLEADARQFESVWLKPNLFFPYDFWLTFWMNDHGCRRMESLWNEMGWRPETILVGPLTNKRRVLSGARSLFRPNHGWFFERERDAMMFLFEA